MDSRPILKGAQKVQVYLDSKTFEHLLVQEDRLANAIVRHHDSEDLEFVRSPLKTTHKDLKQIVEYEFVSSGRPRLKSIKIEKGKSWRRMAFGYRMEDIHLIAREIYHKERIGKSELDAITTVFVQAELSNFGKSSIYITNEEVLLKNRLWFESHFPGVPLNIMSVGEASIFLDLFFKTNGKYYLTGRYLLNKGFWYWLSMRLKIPHYNVGDRMIDALAARMIYALMALDEMGVQYYLGVNNDTMDNTLYHFNYLISLVTGIFDNLALKTNRSLSINMSDLRKVSLAKKSGREFLRQVKVKDERIRDHVNSYAHFINLIYSFRELVIHREGLSKRGFEYRGGDAKWQANFVAITKKMREYIRQCGDKDSSYDPISVWGVYVVHEDVFLDPYHFSLRALETLVEFVNGYLKLLGYPSFLEALGREDDFARTLRLYEKLHLGF